MSGWADALKLALPNLAQGGSITRGNLQAAAGALILQGVTTVNWQVTAAGIALYVGTLAWGLLQHTNAAKLTAVAEMSRPEKIEAFTGIPDTVKVDAVLALPVRSQLAAVSEMSDAVKAAAVAAMPDAIKLAAVEALPDIRTIIVSPNATDGVAAAANDTINRPKVVWS